MIKNYFFTVTIIMFIFFSVSSVLLANDTSNDKSDVPSKNLTSLDSTPSSSSEKSDPSPFWTHQPDSKAFKDYIKLDNVGYLNFGISNSLKGINFGSGFFYNQKKHQINLDINLPYLLFKGEHPNEKYSGGIIDIFFRHHFFNNEGGILIRHIHEEGSGFFIGPGIQYGWLNLKECIAKSWFYSENVYLETKLSYILPYFQVGYRFQLAFLKKYAFAIKPSIAIGYRLLTCKDQSKTHSLTDPLYNDRLGNSKESDLLLGVNIGLGLTF